MISILKQNWNRIAIIFVATTFAQVIIDYGKINIL